MPVSDSEGNVCNSSFFFLADDDGRMSIYEDFGVFATGKSVKSWRRQRASFFFFHNLKQAVLTREYGEGAVRVAFCKSGFKGEAGGFSQASNSFGNF